jgi:hypothetical protein
MSDVNIVLGQLQALEYLAAKEDAADETGLPLETFPASCPFTIEQILDNHFWPESSFRQSNNEVTAC